MRSVALNAPWNWLQKAERLIIGNQKRATLFIKRNHAPAEMTPK